MRIWRFLNGVENGIAIVAVVVMMLTMMTGWIDELAGEMWEDSRWLSQIGLILPKSLV